MNKKVVHYIHKDNMANVHQIHAQPLRLLSFIQEFWPSVQRFNKWLSGAHSLTAHECPMNCDAYLTASSLQHFCYKLRTRQTIQSLSIAGLGVQTASIICTIGQSAAYQTLLLMTIKGKALLSPFPFKCLKEYILTHKCPCLYPHIHIISGVSLEHMIIHSSLCN